jgi:two-component system, cell cycle sensor histidine kinase and response regulator CckA
MNNPRAKKNRRILIIDDNHAIHADFKKILSGAGTEDGDLAHAEADLFGRGGGAQQRQTFELTSAFQGQNGLGEVRQAMQDGRPFAMAFVDVRMPPGWDGIETTLRLWEVDPDLQIVICTAYSDYSWEDTSRRLGTSDRLLVLKKPFDLIEVLQLANTLTEKWTLLQEAKSKFQDLEEAIHARTQELEASNEKLHKEVRERQNTEQVLRTTQEQLDHILAKSPAILYSLRFENGQFTPAWVTENFEAITGRDTQEWYLLTPALEYVEPADRAELQERMDTIIERERLSLEYRVQHKNGPPRWVRDDRQLLRDAAGTPVEIIGCWTDITEQRQLGDQLRHVQKMESVGQLAGGVAHDFNNLLMVILGHSEMLLNGATLSQEVTESLQNIHTAATRAGNLTRQLLAFSRKQIMRPGRLDLKELVGSVIQMLERTIGEHIKVVTQCQPGLNPVFADRNMVEQIVMNLAVNARDAMPNGGQLTISVNSQNIDAAHGLVQSESRPGRFICLSVTDTGSGIPEDVLPRIFEPFYTTKEVGKGTGLGLATVYGNVKQHNGWVEVESRIGHGTTFNVYLPATGLSQSPDVAKVQARAVTGGTETILVVEDEPSLNKLINVTLKRQGYKMHAASSGAEALATWAARLNEVDMLLTDIVMPEGLSGWELAKKLQAVKPSLKVIYMSGYNAETAGTKLAMDKSVRFLEKPFGPQQLARAVRDCLDGIPFKDTEAAISRESNLTG